MKIYILTRNPFPNGLAATNRIRCYATGIISNCSDCEVIVACRTERSDRIIMNKYTQGIYKDIPFRYLSASTIRSSSFIVRRLQDLVSILNLIKFILFEIKSEDIVIAYDNKNEMFFLPLCKLRRIKVYRELCEYPYATVNDSIINKIRRNFNLHVYFPMYSGFITISQELTKLAQRYSSKKSRIIKIPILVDTENINTESYKHARPYIFHSGTMYERKDAIVSTFKAFAIASKQLDYRVDFILAGPKSPHDDKIQEIIKDNKLTDNIIFLGKLSRDEVELYQNGASLAILNKNDNLQNRCGFSTKLGELLLSRTPVVTTTVGEANHWLKDGVSAYITQPHHPELIALQIVRAFSNDEERIAIALEGAKIARENFDCIKQGKRLVAFLNEEVI